MKRTVAALRGLVGKKSELTEAEMIAAANAQNGDQAADDLLTCSC